MIGFILTGHGEFAPGLASALELVAGRQEGFKVVPFDVDKAADYPELIHSEIAAMREQTDGVVVFCDLLGGTPYNEAYALFLTNPEHIRLVAGANFSMLLEAGVLAMSSDDLDAVASAALTAGSAGVVAAEMPADASDDDEDDLF